MNFDEFKIVYEDIMSNVNHEDIMKIICESSWSLKDEIISLWPLIQPRFDAGFSDLFGNGLPGDPEYDPSSLTASPLSTGSSKPGFVLRLNIDENYAKTLVTPFYKALQIRNPDHNPIGNYAKRMLEQKKLNMYFEFFMYVKNAKDGDYDQKYDYQKTQNVEKHTVSGWEGTGFINFDVESLGGPGRDASKIKLCSIDITLTNKQSLMSKLAEFNRNNDHIWSQKEVFSFFGNMIRKGANKLATKGKTDKVKAKFKLGSGLSNSRDVKTNISWENYKIASSETLTLDNYNEKQKNEMPDSKDNKSDKDAIINKDDSSEVITNNSEESTESIGIPSRVNINDKLLTKAIGKDWKKLIKFDKSKIDPADQLKSNLKDGESWAPVKNGKPVFGDIVSDSDPYICGKFEMKITDSTYKIYEVFISMDAYHKSQNKKEYLWENNNKKPFIKVILKSTKAPDKNLLEYKLTANEFEKIDKDAYLYVKDALDGINK